MNDFPGFMKNPVNRIASSSNILLELKVIYTMVQTEGKWLFGHTMKRPG
jgi:hypothetical protein